MSDSHQLFDRRLLTDRRNRLPAGRAGSAFLLERAAEDITDRLALIRRTFPIALNLGAHTGLLGARLRKIPGSQLVIDMDPADRLLSHAEGARVVASEEALPFKGGALDLVVSALALQLVNDLPGTLVQVRRALKPDGLFLANLLGGDTLKELRESWLIAESEIEGGASPRVAPFADVRELGSLLQRAGFALPVADSDRLTVTYPDPYALMADVKGMGASNVLVARRRTPVTRRLMRKVTEVYAERFPAAGGRVSATFEFITLTAWAPHESQQQPLRPGSATHRLAEALDSVEMPLPRGEPPLPTKG